MFQMAITPFICGLINEKGRSIKLEDGQVQVILPNLINKEGPMNRISAKAKRNPFTTEIEITDSSSIHINDHPLKDIDDLLELGFNEKQISLLKQNISATIYLEKIYERSQTELPKILHVLEELLKIEIVFNDRQESGALARLFSSLPQREAFILSDTCGNIDGSTGNPLKNVMFGEIDNAIEYHAIPIAFYNGLSKIELVQYDPTQIRSFGNIPERLKQSLNFLTTGIIPLHPYTVEILNQNSSSSVQTIDSLDAFTLLSKRSFAPMTGDFQIKMSIPAQITSEIRTIDWSLAYEVLYSTDIVRQLAEKQLLPDHLWIQLTQYASQAKHDDRTTFFIRDGLQDAVSRYQQKGIPKELTPITACALTSRNILTPGKSLLESMIEYGFDGLDLFKSISRTIIHIQLDLIRLGWIPDSHTQNVLYLFDFKRKMFSGILQRDAECEKITLNKLQMHGLQLKPTDNLNPKILRHLVHNDEKLSTLYLHHTIYTKHIVPIANILHEKYNMNPEILCQYVKECLIEWKTKNSDYDIDLSGRYYERNLACKTLDIGSPPHYRLIANHPFLPQLSH